MDITSMIAELRTQREQVDNAIAVLQQLALGSGKRRGRPPAWMTAKKAGVTEIAEAPKKRRGRPPGSKNKKRSSSGD